MSHPADLRARNDALRGPGIARAHADREALGKARAALALAAAMKALRWNNCTLAEYLDVDEKVIRMWLKGAQQPTWVAFSLPRAGYTAFVDKMIDYTPQSDRTGTDD